MVNVLGLVSFRIFPTYMGGQKGVALFYKYLQQHANVLLAASSDNEGAKTVGIKPFLYPNRKMYLNVFRLSQLKQLIHSNNIDVIIAEHSYTGWIAWMLHLLTDKPFIIHSHNIEAKRFHHMGKWWWRWYRFYEAWIHKKAQYNFFISEEDRTFALKEFKLSPQKCSVITYGIEDKLFDENKSSIRKQLGLDESKAVLLFNGTMDYEPNFSAVNTIIDEIEPLLSEKITNYEIIISGNRVRKRLRKKIVSNNKVKFIGYVDDIDLYYRAADVFINPVSNDSGVKTKLVEAISNNCSAVSTRSGALGIRRELCGEKLTVVTDGDWDSFVMEIVKYLSAPVQNTPDKFYYYYSWRNIAKKAYGKLKAVKL